MNNAQLCPAPSRTRIYWNRQPFREDFTQTIFVGFGRAENLLKGMCICHVDFSFSICVCVFWFCLSEKYTNEKYHIMECIGKINSDTVGEIRPGNRKRKSLFRVCSRKSFTRNQIHFSSNVSTFHHIRLTIPTIRIPRGKMQYPHIQLNIKSAANQIDHIPDQEEWDLWKWMENCNGACKVTG